MHITVTESRTHNKRSRVYSPSGHGGTHKWVGVDGEGITGPWGHRYVFLACGEKSIENPNGLEWHEIFEFLYSQREEFTAYVGFYLGYDFTQWLKSLPRGKAWKLLTNEGKESRRSRSPKLKGRFLPVDLDGWQVDILGAKRLMIRPCVCECETVKCPHPQEKWMYICDAGHFFQCAFVQAIDPRNWASNAPCTKEEFDLVVKGKARRAHARLDKSMREYCLLEVRILARMMRSLDEGFRKLGIALSPQKWFGPGQAAQAWLLQQGAIRTKDLPDVVPDWFLDASRRSYFGGWFEIMVHGYIVGHSYEYDLNSAYPSVIATLPCLKHGTYNRGYDEPRIDRGTQKLYFVRASVHGSSSHIGTMLHRTRNGKILRPLQSEGWFNWRELRAAIEAGCVDEWRCHEWVSYEPCDCPPPFAAIAGLYETRLHLGKNSILGIACKLVYNSAYGKLCQSVGTPTTANPVYATLITSGCRTAILDAIASHPGGCDAVLMVATDAVFFDKPHPSLPLSNKLGEWDIKERENLSIFKPGMYWDENARVALRDGRLPVFKARGVSARDFSAQIDRIDSRFKTANYLDVYRSANEQAIGYLLGVHGWPGVHMATSFSMTSALQALNMNQWQRAGEVKPKIVIQSSDPSDKRCNPRWDDRGFYRTEPRTLPPGEIDSRPYEKRFGLEDPYSDDYLDATLGVTPDDERPFSSMLRVLREPTTYGI